MDFDWVMHTGTAITIAAAAVILTLAVGITATARLLQQKVAPLLRND
ncbi:MAG: hypothetical protein U1E35_05835 [Rhodospirillales bacterium]